MEKETYNVFMRMNTTENNQETKLREEKNWTLYHNMN